MGKVLAALGNTQEAGAMMLKAGELRRKIVGLDPRSSNQLRAPDFDELVAFWIR